MSSKNLFQWVLYWVIQIIFKSQGLKLNMRPFLFVTLLVFIYSSQANAQVKRIVAIGSSTTVGYGATVKDSCWVSL